MMQHYETEEQQLEAIKAWWQANGNGILWAVLLVLAGSFGFQKWQAHTLAERNSASLHYESLSLKAEKKETKPTWLKAADTLKQQHQDSYYAWAAALKQAAFYVEQKDYAQAEKALQWTIRHSENTELKALATLRLAKVQIQQKTYAKAYRLLDQLQQGPYATLATITHADALQMQGKTQAASQLYQEAIKAMEGKPALQQWSELTRLKAAL